MEKREPRALSLVKSMMCSWVKAYSKVRMTKASEVKCGARMLAQSVWIYSIDMAMKIRSRLNARKE
jgi:hypothetical protein